MIPAEARRRFDVLFGAGVRAAPQLRLQRRLQHELASFRPAVYERIWRDAAVAVGADAADLGGGFLELRRGGRRARVHHELAPLDDPVAVALSFDKPLVHRLLAADGIPVPEHVEVPSHDLDAAAPLLGGGSCVVKPARGTGVGAGITGGIRTPADLRRAALRASRYGGDVLVERQLVGVVRRVLVLDGEVVDTIERDPPEVMGDGAANVLELILAENRRRVAGEGWDGLWTLTVDPDLLLMLDGAGLSVRSVPARGRRVQLKSGTNQNAAHENRTAAAGDLADTARRAAEVVGLRLAGVDLIDDVVLEVNANPGLHHHYVVADRGAASPVAVRVLERALS